VYCYIYDECVQEKRHARVAEAVEQRLTDLGLNGKIVRLALFRDPDDAIRKEVRSGVKTVVVIGNDQTVHRVADVVVGTGVVLGLIPIGEPQVFAKLLGIPLGVAACDILAQRIVESLDAGIVNDHRFFTGVCMQQVRAKVEIDGYHVVMQAPGSVEVRNLTAFIPETADDVGNPVDGKLDVLLSTPVRHGWRKREHQSVVSTASCVLHTGKSTTAIADGVEMVADTFTFRTERGALKVIVGRERLFLLRTKGI
jgi:diacylglycerol kinase family enzyme